MNTEQYITTFLGLHSENTQRVYAMVLTQFGGNVCDATLDDVAAFLKAKRLMGKSDGTVKLYGNALKSFFSYLMARGYRKENPCSALRYVMPSRQHAQVRPTAHITWQQVIKLLKLPDLRTRDGVRDHAIMAILFAGGLRRSELIALNCGDIEAGPDGSTLHLLHTKSGKRQRQALPKWASASVARLIIQRHHEGARNDSALIMAYQKTHGDRVSEKQLYRWFRAWCTEIGIKAAPHAARAAGATRLHEIGVDLLGISKYLRHASTQQAARYVKKFNDETLKPGRKLEI
jgi:integrase/recombinase XerD